MECSQGEKAQFVECGHRQRRQGKGKMEKSVGPRLWSILIRLQAQEFSFILMHYETLHFFP